MHLRSLCQTEDLEHMLRMEEGVGLSIWYVINVTVPYEILKGC